MRVYPKRRVSIMLKYNVLIDQKRKKKKRNKWLMLDVR